ncbi:MAG: ATP-binding cassette domain-containing protein [Candidatus Bipolaricaulota bacterium]
MVEARDPEAGAAEHVEGGAGTPLVRMEGITKRFGGLTALNEVDLEVDCAEVVGLVGDNGAGKSTLINVLSGALEATSGEVFYKGERVDIEAPEDAKELGIETVYQDLALADNLDVAGNLFLGRELTNYTLGSLKFMDKSGMSEKAREVLEVLNRKNPTLMKERQSLFRYR